MPVRWARAVLDGVVSAPYAAPAARIGTCGTEGRAVTAEPVSGACEEAARVVAVAVGGLLWCGGASLPQRIFVKKIVGKENFDKLQMLKMIKESLLSLSHTEML